MTKRRKTHNIDWQLYCLGALRVFLVLLPQSGYIHPDEYFQSVEVLAGNLLIYFNPADTVKC